MGFKANLVLSLLGLPLTIASLIYAVVKKFPKKVELRNKVVVITGASSGLGEACAYVFHSRGCKLVLAGRSAQKLLQLRDDLMEKNPNGIEPKIVTLDLEDLKSLGGKAENILQGCGQVDILINNAGISYRGRAVETSLDVDMKLMAVNYFGHVELTKHMLPSMMKRKEGHIVAISSLQGLVSIPHRTAYAASKHAFHAFFDGLRAELFVHNVNVSVVSPYYLKTNLSLNAVNADGSNYGQMDTTTSSGYSPEDCAKLVLDCVERRLDEVLLAPLYIQLVVYLRRMLPWYYFRLMAKRAVKENTKMNKLK